MKVKKRTVARWLIVLLVLVLAIRIYLPYGIRWYLNNRVLNKMEAYRGWVADVDLALWRGAYTLDTLRFVKINAAIEEPFIEVIQMDLSVDWQSLFHRKIVGEVVCYHPTVNFAFNKSADKAQTGVEEDWTQVVRDLIPIEINRFAMVDGKIKMTNVMSEPKTDLPLENFKLEIRNIRNVRNESADALPSFVEAQGDAPGYEGTLRFSARAWLLQEVPDFDYNLRFENVVLSSLNPVAHYYSGMDFEQGTLSIYSEMAMEDRKFEGYVKPLVKDMRVFDWKEENRPLGQGLREFFGEGVKEVFENQRLQQFATSVPVSGDLNNVKTGYWTAIINAFKNAYIRAFEYKLDQSIDFKKFREKAKGKKSQKQSRGNSHPQKR